MATTPQFDGMTHPLPVMSKSVSKRVTVDDEGWLCIDDSAAHLIEQVVSLRYNRISGDEGSVVQVKTVSGDVSYWYRGCEISWEDGSNCPYTGARCRGVWCISGGSYPSCDSITQCVESIDNYARWRATRSQTGTTN